MSGGRLPKWIVFGNLEGADRFAYRATSVSVWHSEGLEGDGVGG